ncbi:MAG: hypothetical protein N2511_08240, partial [Thermodesulfovibrionales bacterium]|nr:hypothetical protein [Thermodesulfovibrionales bacterium]
DALIAALEWYIESPERRRNLKILDTDDLRNDKDIYSILVRSKILDGKFDYIAFDRLIEKAIIEDLQGYDYRGLVKEIESVMVQLGVMPFDEAKLPVEDPSII